jgi:Catalase
VGFFLTQSRGGASVYYIARRPRHPGNVSQYGRLRLAHPPVGPRGGEAFCVKYHLKSGRGIKNLTAAEAARLAGTNPDQHQRDLFGAIDRDEFPSWTVKVQIMPVATAVNYRLHPFGLTKVWPNRDYPEIPIGRVVLNRNPGNYFAEVEQVAFTPAHFVPGIGRRRTRCCRGGCLPMATHIGIASASITRSYRSEIRTPYR